MTFFVRFRLDENQPMLRAIFLILLVMGGAAHAGWFTYDDYDDCMLGRMKGQPQTMHPNADKLCKKQFNVEFSIDSDSIKWSFWGDERLTVVDLKPSDEYVITSGRFMFSDKPCDQVKDNMGKPVEIKFKNNTGDALSGTKMRCAIALDFRGRYK